MGFKGRSFIKTILVFFLSFQNVDASWHYNSLSKWTRECFQKLPEDPSGYHSRLNSPQFLKEEFVDALLGDKKGVYGNVRKKYAYELKNKNSWINPPAPDLYSVKSDPFKDDVAFWRLGKSSQQKSNARMMHRAQEKHYAYVQACKVPIGSKICFMGDIHGGVHSLLRNLWRLVVLGYLDNDFEIVEPNFYMVFLGDTVDRGKCGVEVWYTLFRLKLANWDKVFLLRGNHEEGFMCYKDGFVRELRKRLSSPGKFDTILVDKMFDFFRCLPYALFLGSGDNFVQCCHGGIHPDYSPEELIKKVKGLQTGYAFEKVSNPEHFNWTDFYGLEKIEDIIDEKKKSRPNYEKKVTYFFDEDGYYNRTGRGLQFSKSGVKEYRKKTGIKLFFRGHQHSDYGLKIVHDDVEKVDPLHWKNQRMAQYFINDETFLYNKFLVFTFSTATNVPGITQPHDCFGILTTAAKYNEWKLKVYETRVNATLDEHVCIDVKDGMNSPDVRDNLIDIEWYPWSLTSENHLSKKLVEQAEKNKGKKLAKRISELQTSIKSLADGFNALSGVLKNTRKKLKGN